AAEATMRRYEHESLYLLSFVSWLPPFLYLSTANHTLNGRQASTSLPSMYTLLSNPTNISTSLSSSSSSSVQPVNFRPSQSCSISSASSIPSSISKNSLITSILIPPF